MKTIIINKEGCAWEFKSTKEAKPYIRKDAIYDIIDGVRVYDDRICSEDLEGEK